MFRQTALHVQGCSTEQNDYTSLEMLTKGDVQMLSNFTYACLCTWQWSLRNRSLLLCRHTADTKLNQCDLSESSDTPECAYPRSNKDGKRDVAFISITTFRYFSTDDCMIMGYRTLNTNVRYSSPKRSSTLQHTLMELSRRPLMILSSSYCRQ